VGGIEFTIGMLLRGEWRDRLVLEFFGELSVTRWVRNCGPFVWLGPRSLDEVEGVIVEGRNIELAARSH